MVGSQCNCLQILSIRCHWSCDGHSSSEGCQCVECGGRIHNQSGGRRIVGLAPCLSAQCQPNSAWGQNLGGWVLQRLHHQQPQPTSWKGAANWMIVPRTCPMGLCKSAAGSAGADAHGWNGHGSMDSLNQAHHSVFHQPLSLSLSQLPQTK